MGSEDEARFQRRAAELGLARTVGLPIEATITARTLAIDELPAGTAPDLPHISVDKREDVAPSAPTRRDYIITGTIGEGGMGRVQLARQRSLDRDVALKTLKGDAAPAPAAALLREARLTGAREHPGVIPVHALGLDDRGRPMLVMKRIDGVDLSKLLRDPEHAAWRGRSANRLTAGLETFMQVCLTVEFAHSRGVIHRDIKPENIMVGGFGEVYLLDWGIAATVGEDHSRTLVGTPAYLAPEMVLGEPITAQTDVYLLGATLHEILTGCPRHQGATVMEVLQLATQSTRFNYDPAIPDELARLCNRATARQPKDRPASAAELREAIADFLRHKTARALSDAAVERLTALDKLLIGDGTPQDLAEAYRLSTEARFGLVQNLREHPSDEPARLAMQRCLAVAIDLELRQGHADTADVLLREMEKPDAALAQRIADTRAASAARARERERLRALEHDLDPTEQAGERSRKLIWAVVGSGAISAAVMARGKDPTPGVALEAALVTFVLVVVGLLLLRRRLLTNAFNRRMAAALLTAISVTVVHRVINVLHPVPIDALLSVDLLLLGCVAATLGASLLPSLMLMILPLAGGIAVVQIWPARTLMAFGISTSATILVAALVLARAKTDRRST